MKKLNNKGITIVELIISFSILMVIAIGMLNVVNEIRSLANEKLENKKIVEFKNDLYKDFHKLMMTKGFKSLDDCSTSNVVCKEIIFDDDSSTTFKINLLSKEIYFNNYKYIIPYSNEINFLNNYESNCTTNCVTITNDENFLIINIPYFKTVILDDQLIDSNFKTEFTNNMDNYNLGFKIIYPHNL